MIKSWFSKKQPSEQQSSVANKPATKKPAAQKTAKSKASKQTKKPSRSEWDISQFQVAEVEGKTRFHDLDLHPSIMQAVQRLGFDYCTPIQAQTLPHSLQGLDVIGKAQTGTGKTAAFLTGIIDQLLSVDHDERYHKEPRALVVAPTRELVMQIAKDAQELSHFTDLHIVTLVGGAPFEKQQKALDAKPVDILVATPGRLIDFVQRQNIYLDQVEVLVLDEADRMLDMGFIPQVKQIVRSTPHKESRQTLLFSATFTQDIINLCNQWTIDPLQVEIEPETVATETVEQTAYMVADHEKVNLLAKMLKHENFGQTIIFANRKDQTFSVYKKLQAAGVKVAQLSGDVAQNKRTRTLADFKSGKIQYLIATDVVGRGIHIDGVTHVINYNLPQEPENYVHRIGRTGRAGASGVAITLLGEEDAYELQALESLLGKKIPLILPPSYE